MKTRWMIVWAMVILAGAMARGAEEKVTFERWYVVNLQGQPAGHAVERETQSEGKITSTMELKIAVGRGGADLMVQMMTEFVETTEGKPISADSTQMLAAMGSQKRVVFTDEGLEVTTIEGGRTSKRRYGKPEGQWLTPAAAMRFAAEQMSKGAETFSYRSFDPSASMKPIEVTVKVLGKEDVEVMGKVVPARKVEVSTSMMPGMKSVEFVDEQGHTVRNSVSMGFMTMEMVAADKALAMTERRGPELLNETLIRPEKAVDRPRELKEATWLLEMKEGKLPDLLETPSQKVKRLSERSAEVTISIKSWVGKEAKPALLNSSMVDGTDERIVKLKDEALKDLAAGNPGASDAEKAEAIRKFVHGYINVKSLDVGMASASEVAQTRTGDCTEHAMLLAAMLRSAGIASRTVTGLMYVPQSAMLDAGTVGPTGIFGFHMWAQAWLDGKWTDLDAVLPSGADSAAFDATHIAISSSEMADGQWVNDLVTLAPIIGQLKITRVDGKGN